MHVGGTFSTHAPFRQPCGQASWHPGPKAHALRAYVLAHAYLQAWDEALYMVVERLTAQQGGAFKKDGGRILSSVRALRDELQRGEEALARQLAQDTPPLSRTLLWQQARGGSRGDGSRRKTTGGLGGKAGAMAGYENKVPKCALTMAPTMPASSLLRFVDDEWTDAGGVADGRALGVYSSRSEDIERIRAAAAANAKKKRPRSSSASVGEVGWPTRAGSTQQRVAPWQMVAPPWALNEVRCDDKAG